MFSVQQMFFISFASLWCAQTEYDPSNRYPPNVARINVAVTNTNFFTPDSFNCSENDTYYRYRKCNYPTDFY